MKNSDRELLLSKLAELSELAPEFRLGQLICNLSFSAKGNLPSAPWDVEDGELIAALDEYIANWRKIRSQSLVEVRT